MAVHTASDEAGCHRAPVDVCGWEFLLSCLVLCCWCGGCGLRFLKQSGVKLKSGSGPGNFPEGERSQACSATCRLSECCTGHVGVIQVHAVYMKGCMLMCHLFMHMERRAVQRFRRFVLWQPYLADVCTPVLRSFDGVAGAQSCQLF